MSISRRFLPRDPADFLRSIVPLGLLAVAAALPGVRLIVLALIVAGTIVAIGRAAPVRWTWAGAVPVAVSLAWAAWRGGTFEPTSLACTDPASPFAIARVGQAMVVVAVLAGLALLVGAGRRDLLLELPARRYRSWALLGFVVGPLALVLGPVLARPFFGPVDYDLGRLGALGPALVFAVSNGVMEELAFRGALMTWSARVVGLGPALVGQAVVFGLAHSGTDVLAAPVILSVLLGVGALLAGIIAVRTRSLLVPIALHVGLDIPIYYAWACSTTVR